MPRSPAFPDAAMAAGNSARRARIAACVVAALLGAALVIATFDPGVLTPDSAIQLREARAAAHHDWHPPLMGWVWSVLDRVAAGPRGMLLFNNGLFWSALALTVYLAQLSPLATAASILAIGLVPPVFSALGVIWKDVTLGALLLLAFALLWWAEAKASRLALLLAVPVMLCASAWRHNAAAAALPLALWVPLIAWPDRRGARGPLLLAGLTLFALLVGATVALNRLLTNAGTLYPAQQLFLHDLAGISVETGRIYLPASLRTEGPRTLEGLRCAYSPQNDTDLFSAKQGTCPLRIIKIVDARRMADLRAEWMRAVLSEPRAYLAHRWRVFREQFAIGVERVCYPLHVGRNPDAFGLEFSPSFLYQPFLTFHTAVAYRTPLFRGWVYLVVLTAVLLVSVYAHGPAPVVVLAASGLLYGVAYLAVGSACGFRFYWWCVVAALTLPIVVAGSRARTDVSARRSSTPPSTRAPGGA